jgi:hypothetical protein
MAGMATGFFEAKKPITPYGLFSDNDEILHVPDFSRSNPTIHYRTLRLAQR